MALPKGFDVPFRLFATGQSPNTVEGLEALDRSIRTIVLTYPGERPYRPGFGSFAKTGVFSNMTEATAIEVGDSIRRAIATYETRVSVKDILFELEDTKVLITISWQPAGTRIDSSTTVEFGV